MVKTGSKTKTILLIHGGAGASAPGKKAIRKLHECLSSGYEILSSGGSALEAVTQSIKALEDSGRFNAGLGANLQFDGVRRLDASLMEGRALQTGSVIGIEDVRNPILVARAVMDLPNVMLTNVGAKRIAERENIAVLPPPDEVTLSRLRKRMSRKRSFVEIFERYFSTVGAIALDGYSNLAAGASTGGISAMFPGRVGDVPIIGAGVYAENSLGAVSCTGIGEYIIRLALAKEICINMQQNTPTRAASFSLKRILRIGGQAGVLILNRDGRYVIAHTTAHMAAGCADKRGIVVKDAFRKV